MNSDNKGYTFDRIAELNITTIANKMDVTYDFHNKNNMQSVEWKLISMINKDNTLINKLNRSWRHPLIRKYSRVPFNSY